MDLADAIDDGRAMSAYPRRATNKPYQEHSHHYAISPCGRAPVTETVRDSGPTPSSESGNELLVCKSVTEAAAAGPSGAWRSSGIRGWAKLGDNKVPAMQSQDIRTCHAAIAQHSAGLSPRGRFVGSSGGFSEHVGFLGSATLFKCWRLWQVANPGGIARKSRWRRGKAEPTSR